MNEKQNVFYLEYPCHSPEEKRWFSIRVMKFEGKEGLIIALHTDITDKKREEEEKEKISIDLVQRNKNLEQFSHIVSHNLRAPVSNILGFAELMKYQDSHPSLIMDAMKGMSNAAYKLDEVIKDLNDILQIRAIVAENKEEIHFQSLVEDIALSIENIIKKENVIIRTDFKSVDKIHSVRTYLYSVFYNLIINSIKFHKPGVSPLIEIKSIRTATGVRVIFKDNGMGIDLQKYQENLFVLYKRFHLNVEGKGMGMFMIKTQVETLGGKISVSSEVNNGTEFTLEFENSKL
jgi:signal transduction histidine kinase